MQIGVELRPTARDLDRQGAAHIALAGGCKEIAVLEVRPLTREFAGEAIGAGIR